MIAVLRMIVVLSLLCAVSGFALSYLKITTAGRIEEQVLNYAQRPALETIFPQAENAPVAERRDFALPDGRKVMVFPIRKDGKLYAVAMENSAPGFGGDLGVMVGFDLDRDTLIGVAVTKSQETPGIGSAVSEQGFTAQFRGKALPVDLASRGGGIDAVSGATISSTGAVDAIRKATDDYLALKAQILATLAS